MTDSGSDQIRRYVARAVAYITCMDDPDQISIEDAYDTIQHIFGSPILKEGSLFQNTNLKQRLLERLESLDRLGIYPATIPVFDLEEIIAKELSILNSM